MRARTWQDATLWVASTLVLLPIAVLAYQSVLDGPIYSRSAHLALESFAFVFSDDEFWAALRNSLTVASGMVVIAVPLGALFAFLLIRTDMPGRRFLEPLMLVPIYVPSIIIGFGYTVAAGPVGFYSVLAKTLLGIVPWNIYSPSSLIVVAGFAVLPYVYLYVATALRGLASDLEEAARSAGASTFRTVIDVSLPMVTPTLVFSAVFIFFMGIELFGFVLFLGSASGFDLLTVYLYKLTQRFGLPAYHIMAAVVVVMVAITMPLIFVQRSLLKKSGRFVSVAGKGQRRRPVRLGPIRWAATALVLGWFIVAAVVPLSGIALRAFTTHWGEGVSLFSALTWDGIVGALHEGSVLRALRNSLLIGAIGGAAAVCIYAAIALAANQNTRFVSRVFDYVVLMPRVVPGLIIGLAFLWVFLLIEPLRPLRQTILGVWLAYMIVYLAYGTRVISGSLLQLGRELREAGLACGASPARTVRDVTLPLLRNSLLASWLLVFIMFQREYATGVYLMTNGTETLGSLIVSLAEGGDVTLMAAISIVNVALVSLGVSLALRFGIRLND